MAKAGVIKGAIDAIVIMAAVIDAIKRVRCALAVIEAEISINPPNRLSIDPVAMPVRPSQRRKCR